MVVFRTSVTKGSYTKYIKNFHYSTRKTQLAEKKDKRLEEKVS